MGRFILCIDDTVNTKLWSEVAKYAFDNFGFRMCLAVDILRLDKENIKLIRDRVAEGHEVCSHTTSHRSLLGLSEWRTTHELGSSKEVIERLFETECKTIVYPFGHYEKVTIRVAKKLGYEYGRGIERIRFRPPSKMWNKMLIGSINLPRDMSDRPIEEAAERWIELAHVGNWTICLFGHGKEDFGVSEWNRLSCVLDKARAYIEVVTFKDI